MRKRWITHEGATLDLDLNADECELFDKAEQMFNERAGMAAISQLYLSPTSCLYRGRTGAEVIELPLYKAIKDMAKRRGIEDGLLSDSPGTKPQLDDFEVRRVN